MSTYKVALTIPIFHVSVVFGFRSAYEASLVHGCVSGRVSGARLPTVEWTNEPPNAEPAEISLSVEELESDLLVQFSGAIQTPEYKVDKVGFHWDFSKVLAALVLPRIVLRRFVILHAATVTTESRGILLPGGSGAGKSSIAFAALQHGLSVPASELSFIRDGEFIVGNSQMTIYRGALERYGIRIPNSAVEIDRRVVLPIAGQDQSFRLSRVVFPRVCSAPLVIRSITAYHARMLLFENAITQLAVAQLVARETCPLGIVPTKQELEIIAQQVELLSHLDPVIVEGSPADVITYLSLPDVR